MKYIAEHFQDFYFFILLHSSNTITETNWSWVIYESEKALEIKISIVFSLAFAGNTYHGFSSFC